MVEMESDEIVFQTALKGLEQRKCSLGFVQGIENDVMVRLVGNRCIERVLL